MNRNALSATTPAATPEAFEAAIVAILRTNQGFSQGDWRGNQYSTDAGDLIEALGLEAADERTDLVNACNAALNNLEASGSINYLDGNYTLSFSNR